MNQHDNKQDIASIGEDHRQNPADEVCRQQQ